MVSEKERESAAGIFFGESSLWDDDAVFQILSCFGFPFAVPPSF